MRSKVVAGNWKMNTTPAGGYGAGACDSGFAAWRGVESGVEVMVFPRLRI